MKTMKKAIMQPRVQALFSEMRLGVEKESQRVSPSGEFVRTPHPKTVGKREYHPFIQTDFSETQMELITPVLESEEEVLGYLGALHEVVLRSLEQDERLWPLSMPPALPLNDQEIQIAKLARHEEVLYRRYLAKTYGKRKQMVSGIHYNIEFTPAFIQALYQETETEVSLETFRNDLYLKVARNYIRYRWLVTYFYGASPISEEHYFETEQGPVEPVRSLRNSSYGYTNRKDVVVGYHSIERYVHDIENLVERGILSEEKEFYAPVRIRGGKRVADLKASGAHYVELRNLDLDPFAPYGISYDALRFCHLFVMWLVWQEETASPDTLITEGNRLNEQVALEHPTEQTIALLEGQRIMTEMHEMVAALGLSAEDVALIERLEATLLNPSETLAAKWLAAITEHAGQQKGLATELADTYAKQAWEKEYQLAGFRDMELSTQNFMFDALQKGVAVSVLDRQDQFLKTQAEGRTEFVKNANMTSKDSYVVPLIMENKTVTKKVLAAAGYRVPSGKEFASQGEAEQAFAYFSGKPIVIKPKSTNYGLGITIFKEGASYEDYLEGVAIAFREDSAILVEEFLEGTEYRFFVINGEVKAILLRVPANVVGDGQKTVAELVADKNQDPRRGTHHRAPLEKIQLGDLEQLMLKEQGLSTTDVPPVGQTVYLRENSNISTGGDSIDVTKAVHPSYQAIAVAAVEALGAKICGIDLIIPDKTQPAAEKATSYGIIEANFNPAMHMHMYPHEGQGRRLTLDVLHLLYPEIVAASKI